MLTINLSVPNRIPASVLTRFYVAHARNWLHLDYRDLEITDSDTVDIGFGAQI